MTSGGTRRHSWPTHRRPRPPAVPNPARPCVDRTRPAPAPRRPPRCVALLDRRSPQPTPRLRPRKRAPGQDGRTSPGQRRPDARIGRVSYSTAAPVRPADSIGYRLTDDQQMLRDAVRVLADEQIAPRAAEIDRQG